LGDKQLALDFWNEFPSKIKRIFAIIIFLFISFIVTIAGVLTPLSSSDAIAIKQEFDKISANPSVELIFGNNLMICLIMFVPALGPIFGSYALYNTGVVVAAESIVAGAPPFINFLSLFIFPFAWLEFIAYSTALAESFWLIWRLFHRKIRKELVNACILISICTVMLLAAAIIEMALVLYFGG
jgi:hypothetical protein